MSLCRRRQSSCFCVITWFIYWHHLVCARNSYFCPQQSSSCSITQKPPQLHEPQVLFLSLSVIFLCYHIEVCVASRRASLPSLFLVSQMFSDFKIWPRNEKKEKRIPLWKFKIKTTEVHKQCPRSSAVSVVLSGDGVIMAEREQSTDLWFPFHRSVEQRFTPARWVWPLGGGKSTQSGNDVTFPSPSRPISVRRGGTRAHTRRGQTHANTHATCTHTRHN